MLGVALAVTILAKDYLGLFLIQFQSAVCKPLYQACFQILRMLLCTAVTDGVIGIPLKRYHREVDCHPLVKHIRQKHLFS